MTATSPTGPTDPASPDQIEAIRKRPAMYIGSTDFFGFIQYLVCPVALLLGHGARRIEVAVGEAGFEIDSDAALDIHGTTDGRIAPFEVIDTPNWGHGYEACVLNALSRRLAVRAARPGSSHALAFERRRRTSCTVGEDGGTFTHLSFAPDDSIFTVTDLPPAIFESYLRRLSFLHGGVRFRQSYAGQSREYFAPGGICDLFDCVSAPYQILHEPIAIGASEGRLQLELVFAYQSWRDHAIWCYVNRGRAVEGGTHEKGLRLALDRLPGELKLPRRPKSARNGVVAVMLVLYPDAVWEGCIKARIESPELLEMIPRLVVANVVDRVGRHPEVAQALARMELFPFPETWSG
jgi:DNA gyrase subunit B